MLPPDLVDAMVLCTMSLHCLEREAYAVYVARKSQSNKAKKEKPRLITKSDLKKSNN